MLKWLRRAWGSPWIPQGDSVPPWGVGMLWISCRRRNCPPPTECGQKNAQLNGWCCESCAFGCAGRVNSKRPGCCEVARFASANTKEMSAVYTLLSFFQVKLRFTMWITAILMSVPELNPFRFVSIFAWTLKALTVVLSRSDFLPFLLPSLPQREKSAFR